ncbi:hypothetical protein [Reichenbachiella sp.]|uniref:hypothetical protein n=1 Tax=Reichenbachiella sp. TaxID=2184521 RepID=UPI003BAF6192
MKQIYFTLFLSFLTTFLFAQNQKLNNLLNTNYNARELPPELTDYNKIGGGIIQKDYGIHQFRKENIQLLLLEQITNDGQNNITNYILDYLEIEMNNSDDYIAYQLCRYEGWTNDLIVAKVMREDKEYFNTVFQAWQINMKTLKFEKIEVDKIDCMNEGWGI